MILSSYSRYTETISIWSECVRSSMSSPKSWANRRGFLSSTGSYAKLLAQLRSSLRAWLPFWTALAAALAVRLVFLDVRPLHHDEGVVAAFLMAVAQGRPDIYDPGGYHGPFLYYVGYWPLGPVGTGGDARRPPVAPP